MHRKKYAILFIPGIIIFIISIFILPADKIFLTVIVPLICWVIYYAWVYIEKKFKA